jgi:hypothetical protein
MQREHVLCVQAALVPVIGASCFLTLCMRHQEERRMHRILWLDCNPMQAVGLVWPACRLPSVYTHVVGWPTGRDHLGRAFVPSGWLSHAADVVCRVLVLQHRLRGCCQGEVCSCMAASNAETHQAHCS